MIVFKIEFILLHRYVGSLKEKRKITKSLIQKLKQDFNLSVLESGDLDDLKQSNILVAGITSSIQKSHNKKEQILNFIENNYSVEIIDVIFEIV